MILAGRRINDGMAAYIANDVIKSSSGSKASLVMGFTRNTKVADLVRPLMTYDPLADAALAEREYGITLTNALPQGPFEAIILAVNHEAIAVLGEKGIK